MKRFSALTFVLLLAACSSSPAPSAEAPASTEAPAATPAPEATAPAVAAAPPASSAAPAADAKVDPPKKPKSKWTVAGKSLSDISFDDLLASLKKSGLNKDGNRGGSSGNGYATVNISVVKGKAKGTFYLARPAAEPTSKTSLATPADTAKYHQGNAKLSDAYDQDADVYVDVEIEEGGDAKDAKAILDSVVKKAK